MKRICIDVGGTFTDCLVLDESGTLNLFKAPTTPGNPTDGLLDALQKAARAYEQPLNEFLGTVNLLMQGTTLATNTLLTRRGAKTGLITTKNFRDVIDLRRGIRPVGVSMYNVFIPPYEPLVPRWLRLGVDERVLYDGSVLTPLDEQETRQAALKLKAEGCETVAVGFLYSYLYPAHEKRAVEIIKEVFPEAHAIASHEILPVWREFERFTTTVVSAYVEPVISRHLTHMESRLRDAGFKGSVLMILANGMVQSVDQCIGRAVTLLNSGPAAAPSGAAHLGRGIGLNNVVSVDMGGTSFDVVLVKQGVIPTTSENWVGDERVAIKMVDVHTVGAGGGSIAWIDSLGLLRVGPGSAGADPGPACYGKGVEPTTTDADLVLGYIPHDYFLGGDIALDPQAAKRAIKKVADPLGMSVEEAAQSMFTTINHVMADQITAVLTKRGYDVRDFSMVAGGGAGPVHAAAMAQVLGIPTVVVPSVAALYSAYGMFAMDIGRDFARSHISRADGLDLGKVNSLYAEMEAEAYAAFAGMGVGKESITFTRTADMRYVGQFHEVEVEMSGDELGSEAVPVILEAFHRQHEALFEFSMPFLKVEFSTFRLKASAPKAPFALKRIGAGGKDAQAALKRRRNCIFSGKQVDTPIYDGERLLAGNVIDGPAIIEERTTTVLIPGGFRCTVDELKNYVLQQ
jgi:N-methylhydantoinase A